MSTNPAPTGCGRLGQFEDVRTAEVTADEVAGFIASGAIICQSTILSALFAVAYPQRTDPIAEALVMAMSPESTSTSAYGNTPLPLRRTERSNHLNGDLDYPCRSSADTAPEPVRSWTGKAEIVRLFDKPRMSHTQGVTPQ